MLELFLTTMLKHYLIISLDSDFVCLSKHGKIDICFFFFFSLALTKHQFGQLNLASGIKLVVEITKYVNAARYCKAPRVAKRVYD
jgi:hypothetical protein